jgi:SAM-dependent methyltransferase
MRRRWVEHVTGVFPWRHIFTPEAIGLDVGAGPDPVPVGRVTSFDKEHGDANALSSYFPAASFDWVHGSQVLEHMHDPRAALTDWLKLVKPCGHVVMTIPSWELYESMVFPSRYNPDHKSTWSVWQKGSPAPHHIYVPDFVHSFDGAEGLLCRLVDTNFDYSIGTKIDQTWKEEDMVEAWVEFVLRKNL